MLSNRASFKALIQTHIDNKPTTLPENNPKFDNQKTQYPQHDKQNRTMTNPGICIISDQYSKSKLVQLQQQISKLRKQMAQKESYHHKEKGNLLNKVQILSAQNIEIKQRQTNLIKLNQTLELAISTSGQSCPQNNMFSSQQVEQIKEELIVKNNLLRQGKRSLQECKRVMRQLQAQKYHIIQQKQKLIYELNTKCKHLKVEKDQMANSVRNDILALPFKKEMINMIVRSLSCFNTNDNSSSSAVADLSQQDLFVQSASQYLESPISKRRNPLEFKGFNANKNSKLMDQSYSRFSSNSIINQLNKREVTSSEYSQQNDQSQKLLCQVCKKVFQEQQFIMHMDQCSQMNHLHKKRSQLQKAIDQLNKQQRNSLSHQKNHKNQHQHSNNKLAVQDKRSNALEEWDQNADTSRSKMSSKGANYKQTSGRQYDERKKVVNRSQVFNNNYTSNRLYC